MDRREFLARAALAAATLTAAGCAPRIRCERPEAPAPGAQRLTAAEWETLAAVQDTLLPSSPGSPGARDVNAIGYLDAAWAEAELRSDDCVELRLLAARLGEGFAGLSPDARDAALRAYTADHGTRWFSLLMGFTLEAYLGDPIHGGNPAGSVWAYLGIPPPYPRPGPG